MARWMWIIILLAAIPISSAHKGGDHQAINPQYDETGEIFTFDLSLMENSALITKTKFALGDSMLRGGSPSSPYALQILDKNGIILEMPLAADFTFHKETMDEQGNLVGSEFNRTEIKYFFRAPALKGSEKIRIVKGETILEEVDLKQFCLSEIACGKWKDDSTCPTQCKKTCTGPNCGTNPPPTTPTSPTLTPTPTPEPNPTPNPSPTPITNPPNKPVEKSGSNLIVFMGFVIFALVIVLGIMVYFIKRQR